MSEISIRKLRERDKRDDIIVCWIGENTSRCRKVLRKHVILVQHAHHTDKRSPGPCQTWDYELYI